MTSVMKAHTMRLNTPAPSDPKNRPTRKTQGLWVWMMSMVPYTAAPKNNATVADSFRPNFRTRAWAKGATRMTVVKLKTRAIDIAVLFWK